MSSSRPAQSAPSFTRACNRPYGHGFALILTEDNVMRNRAGPGSYRSLDQ
jgi:hypothetical protein